MISSRAFSSRKSLKLKNFFKIRKLPWFKIKIFRVFQIFSCKSNLERTLPKLYKEKKKITIHKRVFSSSLSLKVRALKVSKWLNSAKSILWGRTSQNLSNLFGKYKESLVTAAFSIKVISPHLSKDNQRARSQLQQLKPRSSSARTMGHMLLQWIKYRLRIVRLILHFQTYKSSQILTKKKSFLP